MYIASWNAKGYTKIYSKMNSVGYFVGSNENPTTFGIESLNEQERNDLLYSPNNKEHSAYWIATPSARGTERLIYTGKNNVLEGGTCNDPQTLVYGIRPVVCLNGETIGKVEGDLIII